MDLNLPPTLDVRGYNEHLRRRLDHRRPRTPHDHTTPTLLSEPSRHSNLSNANDGAAGDQVSQIRTVHLPQNPAPLTENFAPALYAQRISTALGTRSMEDLANRSYESDGPNRNRRHQRRFVARRGPADAPIISVRTSEYSRDANGNMTRSNRSRRAGSTPATGWTSFPSNLDGLGDRERSFSPDNWDTMLTTIAPDDHLPTADSSFTSAVASASFSASDAQANSQFDSRSASASSSRTHLTVPSDGQSPVYLTEFRCITTEDSGSETEADDSNDDDYNENMDLDPERTPQLGDRHGILQRSRPSIPHSEGHNSSHNRHRSHDRSRNASRRVLSSSSDQDPSQDLMIRYQHHSSAMSTLPTGPLSEAQVDGAASNPAPASAPFDARLSTDEDANADMYGTQNQNSTDDSRNANSLIPLHNPDDDDNNDNNNNDLLDSDNDTHHSTTAVTSTRHRPRRGIRQRDPFLEWAAGEASTQLERLRCIIDELAHRDDIPDEWWMSIGLTRGMSMDMN